MSSTLRSRWATLGTSQGWPDAGLPACEDLLARYGDPRRAYHNEQHLLECLMELDAAAHLAEDSTAVELAIWFHDAIYDATRNDNETASADLAADRLSQLAEPTGRIVRLRELILDTAHRGKPVTADGRLIVDIDLSILGKDEERFDAYDAAIRIEYAHVSDDAYRRGRAAVLRGFLGRPAIYRLPEFVARYEQRARANLARAIARLEVAPAPGQPG